MSAAKRAEVGGVGSAHHRQLAQQVDELLDVAHEVPRRELGPLEHVVEALAARPTPGDVCEPVVGCPGAGQMGRLFLAPAARRPAPPTNPGRARRALGGRRHERRPPRARLERAGRDHCGQLRGVEPVEEPFGQRLGHEEVGLVVDPGQDRAARRQAPRGSVHVPEVLEQGQRPVQALRQGVMMPTVEELREGPVQDEVRLIDAVAAHQVHRQVVGGPERRPEIRRW